MTTQVDERPDLASLSGNAPRVRPPCAVVVSRFPRIDEPHILREINELEGLGQPVVLVPLLREHAAVMHEEAKPWVRLALYTRFLSFAVVRSNFRALRHAPRAYLHLLASLIEGTILTPGVLLRTLALFPKSVHLAERLKKQGVRHVHAHSASHPSTIAYIIASLTDITYSITVYGPDIFQQRPLMREKIAQATFVRTISTFNKAFLAGLFPVVAENKLEVVHAGVNPDVYRQAAESAAPRAKPRIVSVSHFTETKAFSLLVQACALLKREGVAFECVISGSGRGRAAIAAAIREHDVADCVQLLGPTPQHIVAQLMGGADLFVLPSVIAPSGQMDGIPVSLMEAMAAGKPVIAAALSGIPELVEHGRSGILVDMTHAEKLAGAIRRLIDDPELRARMGAVGRERVRSDFNVHNSAAALVQLIEQHHGVPASAAAQIAELDWRSLNVSTLGIRHVRQGARSFLADVTVTDGSGRRDVFVKSEHVVTRDGLSVPAAATAREEFERLNTLRGHLAKLSFDATAGIAYTVPKPLLVDERHGAVVMERAPGRSLEDIVRWARNRGQGGRLLTPFRRAARWLRMMQSVTHAGDDGRHLLTAIVVLALSDLDLAAAAERGIARQRSAIAARLRELEGRLAGTQLAVVGHHGDYSFHNIFISDRRVDVLDFGSFREGLELEDAMHFFVQIQLYLGYPGLSRSVERLGAAFLEAYAGGAALDADAVRLFTLTGCLRILARGGSSEGGRIRDLLRRRALRGMIERTMA